MVDESNMPVEEDDEDQMVFLFMQLLNLDYGNVARIMAIEKALYKEIAASPEDTLGQIALIQVQLMTGNYDKAKAIAYGLWEKGPELDEMEEYIYVNHLLNLGLVEMASVLLKPKFEALQNSIGFYYPLLLKFSTMTGNISLLEKLITYPSAPENDDTYLQIINLYKNYKYAEHFKNVQKIILDTTKGRLCTFDYEVPEEAVKPEILVSLYVSGLQDDAVRIENEIREKLQNYYETAKISKLSSFSFDVKPISRHPSLDIT